MNPIPPETDAGQPVIYSSPAPGIVPVPARVDVARGNVLTQWQFADADRAAIAAGATLLIEVITQNLAPQPIGVTIAPPRGTVPPSLAATPTDQAPDTTLQTP